MSRRIVTYALFALVVLAALFLRVYALDFGLPFAVHIDESRFVSASVHILQSGDFNPGWFRQPSLYTYLLTGVMTVYAVTAGTQGAIASVADLFRPDYYFLGAIPLPGEWLAARLLTALLGVLSAAAVWGTALSAWKRPALQALTRVRARTQGFAWAAFAGAALLAVSPVHVFNSHLVTADVLAGLLALACLWACLQVSERGRRRDYALAGLLAGLAASAKYNVGIVLLVVLVAHVVRWRAGRYTAGWQGLALAALAAAAGFLIGTPYALLSLPRFLDDLIWELRHNAVLGHPGREGESGAFYAQLLLGGADRWMVLLGALGFTLGVLPGARPEQRRAAWILGSFVAIFGAMLALTYVHFDRFAVPLLPALAVLAGFALERGGTLLAAWLHARAGGSPGRARAGFALALLALLALAEPALASFQADRAMQQRDVMLLARDWADAHIPAGAPVAVETFGALLDPGRYRLLQVNQLIEHDAGWYGEQGYTWFIASAINYQRFFDSAQHYPQQAAQYHALFDQWELVQRIEGPSIGRPGFVVRIYRARK